MAREVAAGRGIRLDRRDDLDEAVAQREHHVGEPECADPGVAKRLVEVSATLNADATGSSSAATSTA